jgi:hypothetical protein
MAMTEAEIFNSTDPIINTSDVYKYTVTAGLYRALEVVALDSFDDRYEIFLLPLSFTPRGKKSLQKGLENYVYTHAQKINKPFLISVFNQYEADHGKIATIELLEWMRNVTDSTAASIERRLSTIYYTNKREKKTVKTPPRVERYFGLWQLLRDQYDGTIKSYDLESVSKWDIDFHAKHAHDYYGTIENNWDPSHASFFADTIFAKIAWENACQGSKPDEAELKLIGDWIIESSDHLSAKDYESPAALFVSPILRAEYVKRRLIMD